MLYVEPGNTLETEEQKHHSGSLKSTRSPMEASATRHNGIVMILELAKKLLVAVKMQSALISSENTYADFIPVRFTSANKI